MMSTSNIFWIFVQLFMLTTAAKNYCKLCDKPGTHTMCLYRKPGPGPDCGPNSEKPLNESEIEDIVRMHNELRNKIAIGKTNLPRAADMNQLSWDDELKNISQRWMDQCKLHHDKCRASERFPVGQNLGMSGSSDPKVDHIKIIVEDWANEMQFFNATQVEHFHSVNKIGHFTQMIWARTYFIGCGRVSFKHGTTTGEMLACNYGRAGNVLGQHVYTEGAPCTLCPRETYCHSEYFGLCSRSSRPLCYLCLGIILQICITVMLITII